MTDTEDHYNMQPRRKAEFYTPPNHLKLKVGNGGLTENILNKAQALLENNSVDFTPLAETDLDAMMKGLEQARTPNASLNKETMISAILFPGMQLKANGGMFQYELVTHIADRFIQFMEVIDTVDNDALEIIIAFHTTILSPKLFGAELLQRIAATALEVFGMEGQAPRAGSKAGPSQYALLRSVANTIDGRTSEIQRSVIATRGLGLPRE